MPDRCWPSDAAPIRPGSAKAAHRPRPEYVIVEQQQATDSAARLSPGTTNTEDPVRAHSRCQCGPDRQYAPRLPIHTVNSFINIGSFANLSTLDLRLTGDAATNTVTASYAVNGGAFVPLPQVVTLTGSEATSFFPSAARAGCDRQQRGSGQSRSTSLNNIAEHSD